jgi:hypothetical protein
MVAAARLSAEAGTQWSHANDRSALCMVLLRFECMTWGVKQQQQQQQQQQHFTQAL